MEGGGLRGLGPVEDKKLVFHFLMFLQKKIEMKSKPIENDAKFNNNLQK